MKNKLVIWGTDQNDERILVALKLEPTQNKVDIWTFPDEVATETFSQQLFNEWRNDQEVAFPEQKKHYERELTISEDLLPEDIKVERGDLIQRAKTEWHFVVLSSKLRDVYDNELEDLNQRIQHLDDFSDNIWEELKTFWDKVQVKVKEGTLYRDHADEIRDRTNALFADMKKLREKANEKFRELSKDNVEEFKSTLARIEDEIENNFRFKPLFEELKKLQRDFKQTKFTREDRSKIWQRLDGAFKKVKAIRFGDQGGKGDNSALSRLERRHRGLLSAIEKMERSIGRDNRDLKRENDRIAKTDGQLESQIRQAKILMIEERVRSKQEKLDEMVKTRQSLEDKMAAEKAREEKRKEQERIKEAEKAAREKIAQQIKEEEEKRKQMEDKIEEAAEKIVGSNSPEGDKKEAPAKNPAPSSDSKKEGVLAALGATLGEDLGDVVDTVRAVAKVVGEKIEDAVEEVTEEVEEAIESITGQDEEE